MAPWEGAGAAMQVTIEPKRLLMLMVRAVFAVMAIVAVVMDMMSAMLQAGSGQMQWL